MNSQSLNLMGILPVSRRKLRELDLPSMVSTLLKSVNPEKDGLNSTLFLEEIENFETHLPEMNHEEALHLFYKFFHLLKSTKLICLSTKFY